MELSSFRLFRAYCCSFVMLGVVGCASWRMVLTALLTVSARSASSGLTADSTLAIISVAGTLERVTAKFRPFFSKDTSASLRVRDDKLITQFVFSTKDVGECQRNHQRQEASTYWSVPSGCAPQSVKHGVMKCLYDRATRLVTKPSIIVERRNTRHLYLFLKDIPPFCAEDHKDKNSPKKIARGRVQITLCLRSIGASPPLPRTTTHSHCLVKSDTTLRSHLVRPKDAGYPD